MFFFKRFWFEFFIVIFGVLLIGLTLASRSNAQDAAVTQCSSCHPDVMEIAPGDSDFIQSKSADGIYGEPPFREAVSIETLPNREMMFEYDADYDGEVDTIIFRAIKDFVPAGPVFSDFDPKYILVPRDGYYRVLREPNRVRSAPAAASFVGGIK